MIKLCRLRAGQISTTTLSRTLVAASWVHYQTDNYSYIQLLVIDEVSVPAIFKSAISWSICVLGTGKWIAGLFTRLRFTTKSETVDRTDDGAHVTVDVANQDSWPFFILLNSYWVLFYLFIWQYLETDTINGPEHHMPEFVEMQLYRI